jgi:hypothetical protein
MNMTLTMGPSLFPIGIRMVLSRSLLLAISVSDSVRRIRLCFRNRSIITKLLDESTRLTIIISTRMTRHVLNIWSKMIPLDLKNFTWKSVILDVERASERVIKSRITK